MSWSVKTRHSAGLVPHRHFVFQMALVALGFLVASAGVAYAYFSAAASGTYGLASAGRLTPPASFTALGTSTTQVTLSWTAPNTAPPGTYTFALAGPLGAGGNCTPLMSTSKTSCEVKGLSDGKSYSWTLRVKFHTWESANKSASATTKVAPPNLCGIGSIQSWSSPSTKHVTYPGCVQPTDILVLILARSHNNTASCPTGWTLRAADTVKSGGIHGFLEVCSAVYKSGTYVPMTVNGTAVRGSSAEVAAFEGVTTTTPFDKTALTTRIFTTATAKGGGALTAPSFTTTSASDLALSVVMENSATTTIPTLTLAAATADGFTGQPSGGMQTTESDGFGFATKAIPAPGLVKFPTWKGMANSTDVWVGESLALMADPPPVSPAATLVPALPGGTSKVVAVPSVTSVTPSSGSTGGGTAVTITGTAFSATSTVSFGGAAAESVTFVSTTSIVATSPIHAQGQVDIRVTNPTGSSATSIDDQFTFRTVVAPSVTGISPVTGTTAGGTTVVIIGTGFTPTTTVMFGASPAAHLTVTGPTALTVVSPAHVPGLVNVRVTTLSGTSPSGAADQFTYMTPAAVTASAGTSGGTG